MPTNNIAPNGLVFSRNRRASSPTYQSNRYKIRKGFASNIGRGDLVSTGTGANQGYVVPAAANPANILGVFDSVLPYFDLTLQALSNGLNGAYPSSANAQNDVDCIIIDDPDAVFRAQVQNGQWAQNWRGANINFVAATNGVPNISGISTLILDGTTVANTPGLPFRIQQLVDVSPSGNISAGGSTDPVIINPFIEVCLNFGLSEQQQATGI